MSAASSARLKARAAGFLYLIVVVAGVAALSMTSGLIVGGDAEATAKNILAAEQTFRLSFTINLLAAAAYVGVIAILYELFRPVSRTLSVFAAFFGLVGCASSAASMLNHLATLYILKDAAFLASFDPAQSQALARLSLKLGGIGNSVSLVFFGFYCLSLGMLVLRSTFLPHVLGALLVIAGAAWLTNSVAGFLALPFAGAAAPILMGAAALGEGLFTLWLLIVGVNAARWREQGS